MNSFHLGEAKLSGSRKPLTSKAGIAS
jgi:hypothetical protein